MMTSLNPLPEPVPSKSPLKSKTFWFTLFGAAIHIAADWRNPQAWGTGIAAVGTAYGVREAISKNGVGA